MALKLAQMRPSQLHSLLLNQMNDKINRFSTSHLHRGYVVMKKLHSTCSTIKRLPRAFIARNNTIKLSHTPMNHANCMTGDELAEKCITGLLSFKLLVFQLLLSYSYFFISVTVTDTSVIFSYSYTKT